MKPFSKIMSPVLLAIGLLAGIVCSAEPMIKDGDRVFFAGDSITAQKRYTVFLEAYFTACAGLKNVKTLQAGIGGEYAGGFVARMDNEAFPWKPTMITICYGMNDGNYQAYTEGAGKTFRAAMEKIVKASKDHGANTIIATPGVVDTDTFQFKAKTPSATYNETLRKLGEICRELATENASGFANLHQPMLDTMTKVKAARGAQYHIAGTDGFHPEENGHLVMAYGFLKGLGFQGKIAEIQLDFKGEAKASAGHRVVSWSKGVLELESTRYPFCFALDPKAPQGPSSLAGFIEFFPEFAKELDLFELKVSNLPSPRAELTWGKSKKTFTKEQLEKGINLASEFLENPFSEPFANVLLAIRNKQNFETKMLTTIRGISPAELQKNLPDAKNDAKLQESMDYLRQQFYKQHEVFDAQAKAAVVPVTHKLEINPLD